MALLVGALASSVAFAAQTFGSHRIASAQPGSAVGAPGATEGALGRQPEPAEIASARTATSDTYRLSTGEREVRIYGAPVNYEDSRGNWIPLEDDLESAADGNGYRNGADSFALTLPERLGGSAVKLSGENGWVSDRLLDEGSGPAEIDGNTAVYRGLPSGMVVEIDSTPVGVDETIQLEDEGSSTTTFRYELEASPGLSPSLEKNGSVTFDAEDDRQVATLPAPVVSDDSGAINEKAVAFNLKPLPTGNWLLVLEIDQAWLESSSRAWPVSVDPSMSYKVSGDFDCEITPSVESGCYPWNSEPEEAGYGTIHGESHVLIGEFPIETIPKEAWISEASLNLYDPRSASKVGTVQARRVTVHWEESADWNDAWNRWGEHFDWPEGGAYTAEGGEQSTAERGTGPGWWKIGNLGPIVREWSREFSRRNGQYPDFGLLIKEANETSCGTECAGHAFAFDSGQATPAEDRPYLSVQYFGPAPLTSRVTSPSEGTRTADKLKLKSAWTSAGVENVTYQFREGTRGPFETIPASLVTTVEGKSISWPVSVGLGERESTPLFVDAAHLTPTLRKRGGVVQVRALFEGPTEVAGYSAPNEVEINRALGGPKDATATVGPGTVDLLTGNFATSATDVSISTFNSSLDFTRTFNTRGLGATGSAQQAEEMTSPLGPGWVPADPVEEAGSAQWRSITLTEQKGVYEEAIGTSEPIQREYSFDYAHVTADGGGVMSFAKTPTGTWEAPAESPGWTLKLEGGAFVLSAPNGDRTKFTSVGSGTEYLPVATILPAGSGPVTTTVEYQLEEGGKRRIHMLVAPPPPGVSCISLEEVQKDLGCRALVFNYGPATSFGAPKEDGERLVSVAYYAPGLSGSGSNVIQYEYNSEGRLSAAWDPNLSPALKVHYTYEATGTLKAIAPAGEEPWTLHYGSFEEEEGVGRLTAVSRPSLVASPTTATTTIVYGVPLSGGAAPYQMDGSSVNKWGQTDVPTGATAVFPPSEVPASPPTSYTSTSAIVYYTDSEGREVNVATAPGAGTGNPAITTSEYDEFGDVVRELSPRNRLEVLAEPPQVHLLDTERVFNGSGTRLEEEEGPLHEVHLEGGESRMARFHRVLQYDQGMPAGTTPDPNLVTRETTGAYISGSSGLQSERITETAYDWTLRKPETETVVMGGENAPIVSTTLYNNQTGLPTEARQPNATSGESGGATKLTYYTVGSGGATCENASYAGLECEISPGAQPNTPGVPPLVVKQFTKYDFLDQATEVVETGGSSVRKTGIGFDGAGRKVSSHISGGGVAVPETETVYGPLGLPVREKFSCKTECPEGGDIEVTYNALGQLIEYEDGNKKKSHTTFDVDGRPVSMTDAKGTQTLTYNGPSGLPTKLEDSSAGTFTASYDVEGQMSERTYPDGLAATTIYNSVGEPMTLRYKKGSAIWFEEEVKRSVYGQIETASNSHAAYGYQYDDDGRLVNASETPSGEGCTTRHYTYDADSNRTESVVSGPYVVGGCSASGGKPQSYFYDPADRLTGEGVIYDAWGRITSLPASDAGGHSLSSSYFGNNMIASQAQNGLLNTFSLDASGRQRTRSQGGGGLEGIEVFHFDGPSDRVSWSERGSTWTREIDGIGGELVAEQESGVQPVLKLVNLHGDVIASAELSPTATKLIADYRYDEFGEPVANSSGRYGWLGGYERRTELPAGVIQMGARSYIPQLGRFLSPDPVAGGSANDFDYADQDPVNGSDLSGTCGGKNCNGISYHRAVEVPKRATAVASMTCNCGGGTGNSAASPIPPPVHVATCAIQVNPGIVVWIENTEHAAVGDSITYTCTQHVYIAAHVATSVGPGEISEERGHDAGVLKLANIAPLEEQTFSVCMVAASAGESKNGCWRVAVDGPVEEGPPPGAPTTGNTIPFPFII